MIGKSNSLIELQSLDKELYKNLKFLKDYEGDARDLDLNFTVQGINEQEVELIKDGKQVNVTNENKFRYIYLVAGYRLNNEIKNQVQYFLKGMQRVIDIQWIQMFDEDELQMIISGDMSDMDIKDLRAYTAYEGYGKNDSYIKDFFKIVENMSETEKNLLIKFVTSCERAPLLGFSNLQPNFTIVRVDSEKDTKLPSSSTCFNRLYLPKYSSSKILQEKLLKSIVEGVGFHLA